MAPINSYVQQYYYADIKLTFKHVIEGYSDMLLLLLSSQSVKNMVCGSAVHILPQATIVNFLLPGINLAHL